MALVAVHLKGFGDPSDHSTFCPFDIAGYGPDDTSFGARVSQMEWQALGRDIAKFPGSFGVVQIPGPVEDLPNLEEPDREIRYVPKGRRLSLEEKANLKTEARGLAAVDPRQVKGSLMVRSTKSGLSIGTLQAGSHWVVKSPLQLNSEANDVEFFDSFDGRKIDFDLNQIFVRRRRYKAPLNQGEVRQILAGKLPVINASRIVDKRETV